MRRDEQPLLSVVQMREADLSCQDVRAAIEARIGRRNQKALREISPSIAAFTSRQDLPASRSRSTRRLRSVLPRTSSITSWLACVSSALLSGGGPVAVMHHMAPNRSAAH